MQGLQHLEQFDTLHLRHCWPLCEQPKQFELGLVLNSVVTDAIDPHEVGAVGAHHAGCWECDLADESLIWSGGVYDIFGMERGAKIRRSEVVGHYCENSRAILESLRAYALKHHQGFTIDTEIQPGTGGRRWIRVIAAPVVEDGRAIRLHGLKFAL